MTFSRGSIWAVAGTRPVSASPITLMCSRIADIWLRICSRSALESARRASAATWLTVFLSMLIAWLSIYGGRSVGGGADSRVMADGKAREHPLRRIPSLLDVVHLGGEGAAPKYVEVVL